MGCGGSTANKYEVGSRRRSTIYDCDGASLDRPPTDDGEVCDEPSPTYVKLRHMKNHVKGGVLEAINRKRQGDSPPESPHGREMQDPLSARAGPGRPRKLILVIFSWLDTLPMEEVSTPRGSEAFSDSEVFKHYDADEELPQPSIPRLCVDVAPRSLTSDFQLRKLQAHIQKTVDLQNTTMYTEFKDPNSVPIVIRLGLTPRPQNIDGNHLSVLSPRDTDGALSTSREDAVTPQPSPRNKDYEQIPMFCNKDDFESPQQKNNLSDSPEGGVKVLPALDDSVQYNSSCSDRPLDDSHCLADSARACKGERSATPVDIQEVS